MHERVQLLEALALQLVDDEGAGRDAPDVAHAAEHDHGQRGERHGEPELVRRHGGQLGRVEHARQARGGGADREREQLGRDRVDAHARRRELVLAEGDPRPAEARVLEPVQEDDRDGDDHHDREVVQAAGW